MIAETDPRPEGEVSESTIMVDGVIAYQRVYQAFHGEPLRWIREVWLEKEGKVYIISCWTTPGRADRVEADFSMIIDSFHVK